MKILLSLSLLLGFSVPAIAHNEFNRKCWGDQDISLCEGGKHIETFKEFKNDGEIPAETDSGD